jgi:lipopolysaccharide export system protein LptA
MTGGGSVLRHLAGAAVVAVAAGLAAGAPALAQGLALGHSNQPVEILADQNIEWQREQQRYIARGNASAKQGDTTVYADVLTAYYRPQPKPAAAGTPAAGAKDAKPGPGGPSKDSGEPQGGTQIFRYEAEGHVRIVSPTDTAVGDKGIYDIDTGVLVLTGKGLKFTTPSETVTARDSLEYWDGKQMAVARGDAVAVTQDKRVITGDILTSYFVDNKAHPPPATARNVKTGAQKPQGAGTTQVADKPGEGEQGNNRLQRIEGFGHVHVSTPTEIVTADRGIYNADTGIAMMSDNVRITRGENQSDGDFAEVNLNTGISRLLARGDGKQVRGLFIPQQKQSADQSGTSQAPEAAGKPAAGKPETTSTKKATP